jgi:hypothetical protein
MYDYGTFAFESKAQVLERAKTFWNPDKTQFWTDVGVDLVIDRREGYLFWDMAGRRLIDLHLNGGTYNLGHRNPELIAVLEQAMGRFDIGNHHFPALARAGIKKAVNGPFTFSPDGNPLVGPVKGLPNYWLACAVMAGFSQGGGIGLVLSRWMTENDPGQDVLAMDAARFGVFATPRYTSIKVQENYRRRFRLAYNEVPRKNGKSTLAPGWNGRNDSRRVSRDCRGQASISFVSIARQDDPEHRPARFA